MSYYPPAYNLGEGLRLLTDFVRPANGSPISLGSTTTCEVTLDHVPFSLIHANYYSLQPLTVTETIDISAAVSSLQAAAISDGHTLDYFRLGFAVRFDGQQGLTTCGDPDYQQANFDGQGPLEATTDPDHGWFTDWDANGLTIHLDGTSVEMAAIINGITSGPVFTSVYTQVVPPVAHGNVAFGGDILRATAHTWTGQDPTNDAARTMFVPGEITNVTWALNTANVGQITTAAFAMNVIGYRRISGTTPPPASKGFVAVL